MNNKITILLVDDHKVLRDGLRALLESEADMQVIAEADTGGQAITLAHAHQPDIIVMDLGLPDMSGLDAIHAIRQENKSSRIIVLSMYSRREFVIPAIEAGCDGYVPKSATHTSLLQAIRVVLRGERFLHPTAATALMERFTEEKSSEIEQFNSLSEREQEVLRLAASGCSNSRIAEILCRSEGTIKNHFTVIFGKLGVTDRTQAVVKALSQRLLVSPHGRP